MMEEECPCDFVAAPEDTMETTSLEKHAMMLLPTSEPIYTIGASEYFKVGTFHEIDHSKLSPNSPVQLKSVRIAMVSGKVENQVAVRYPSILSLRTHFSDSSFGKSEGKKIPALDEKYVMGLECAIQSLYKIVPAEEFTEKRNSWSFWASSSELESIQDHEIEKQIFFTDSAAAAATNLVSKQGPCWSQLKFSGMVQWGQKRQVRFLGRHEEQKFESLLKETRASVELSEGANEKRKRVEEEEEEETEAEKAVPFGVMRMTRQCKRSHQNVSSSSGLQKSIVKNDPKKQQLVVHSNKKRKVSIDRWSAERYKMAEENMLKVMKAKGAVYGNPIMRPDLRSEARKHIGDTGLLDHLLKHMAGKVAPGGAERFRRRHNAEGAMEYWLESADLADIRKEVGVQDPYWTPPPGWKFGDNLSQDHVTARELREIKEDLLKLKLDVRELAAKKGEEALAIVTTPSSCLSSFNWEDCGSLVSKQEVYAEFVKKKAKAEQQLKEISLTLSEMEEELSMLKPRVAEELITSESVMPPPLILGPTSMAEDNVGERIKEKKENEDHATESMDTVMQKGFTAEEKAAKIERLKSGFQICKPQGTFVWPIMGMSPQTVVNPDDYTVVLTPSSASSSTTSAPKPLNPFKPLAEKRPVSTATLTYVTGPFSPNISPSLGTPGSKITTTNIGNTSSINLNEAPLILE